MNQNDAIVVTEGQYRGWIGYLQSIEGDLVAANLFSHEGDKFPATLFIDQIRNVEPFPLYGPEDY